MLMVTHHCTMYVALEAYHHDRRQLFLAADGLATVWKLAHGLGDHIRHLQRKLGQTPGV